MRVGNKKEAMNCKVLVVGKSNVGKSHLLLSYISKDKSAILLPRATGKKYLVDNITFFLAIYLQLNVCFLQYNLQPIPRNT